MTEPIEPGPSSSRAARVRAIVLLVGLIGLALATREALDGTDDVQLPGPIPIVVALVLTRISLACSAHAWVALIGPGADDRLLRAALYESQLVKYLPAGGFVQAASQIGVTATQGLPLARVTLAYATLTVEIVAAGLFLSSGIVLVGDAPTWLRVVAPLGLLAPLALTTRLLTGLVTRLRRVSARLPSAEELPTAAARRRAFLACLGTHALYAGGFTVLMRSIDPEAPVVGSLLGFTIAWVAGFLVVPLPGGVGVREAVLLAVAPAIGAGPLLAASLAQRLVAIAAEVVAVLGNRLGGRWAARRAQVGD